MQESKQRGKNSKEKSSKKKSDDIDEEEIERIKLEQISREKKKYLEKLIKKGITGKNREVKLNQIVHIAEKLVNFLLSRNQDRNPSKSHIEQNESDDDVVQENEDIMFLTKQPSILQNGKLKDFQLVGLNWLISLYSIGFNGILADEMGLGKTIQTISFLAYLKQYKKIQGPHLIVCPNSVVSNWYKEFRKWLPDFRVVKLNPRKEFRESIIENEILPQNFDVVITSYQGVDICYSVLHKIKWIYNIVDEAHRLKNDQSLLFQAMISFKVKLKILLTGTPLQNNLKELWCLLNFILPEIFNDSTIFEEYNDKNLSDDELEKKNFLLIQKLHQILRPFILKRTKEVTDKSIPPKKEIHLYVGLTQLQTDIYRNLLLKKQLISTSSKNYLMNILMHLRKACNHPYLFEGIEEPDAPTLGEHLITTSGKMMILDKLLEKLKYNHQVIIFSGFVTQLHILEDYLRYKQYEYCIITGTTQLDEREQQIEEFTKQGSKKFVFLLSTRAGGLGINLTTADTVILYDSDWNPQVDLQAMDRAHRIGQTKMVNVYRLITENTIEEKIIERQKIKMKWDNLVILKGQVSQKKHKMNKNDLKELIQFGCNEIFKAEQGTIKEEELDKLLERGQKKAQQLDEKINEYIQKNEENILDLGLQSINIFEFEGDDYKQKRDQDQKTYEELRHKDIYLYSNRQKNQKLVIQQMYKKKYKSQLQDYHLYDDMKELDELLRKECDENLTEEENKRKQILLDSGFSEITKSNFSNIIKGFEKHDCNDYKYYAQLTKIEEQRIIDYIKKLLQNLDKLQQGKKIKQNIEKYQKEENFLKQSQIQLKQKIGNVKNYFEIDLNLDGPVFNPVQEKFILFQALKLGSTNYEAIFQEVKKCSIFRFNYSIQKMNVKQMALKIQEIVKNIIPIQDQEPDEITLISEDKNKKKKQKKVISCKQLISKYFLVFFLNVHESLSKLKIAFYYFHRIKQIIQTLFLLNTLKQFLLYFLIFILTIQMQFRTFSSIKTKSMKKIITTLLPYIGF